MCCINLHFTYFLSPPLSSDPAQCLLCSVTSTNCSVLCTRMKFGDRAFFLFYVPGWNLVTELSLWSGQSCGIVYQQQFVTRTICVFKCRLRSHFLARVLVVDNVTPFRSILCMKGSKPPSTTATTTATFCLFCYLINFATCMIVTQSLWLIVY